MSDVRKSRWKRSLPFMAAAAVLGISGVALGLPWDIDMADAQNVKAYERRMAGLPEGVVSQDSVLSPKKYRTNASRGTPEAQALSQVVNTPERRELGGEMYRIYCSPCHGADGATPGPVAQTPNTPDRFPGIIALAGPGGVAAIRDDAWIYLTIRNGGANMPAYGHAMTNEEMWSIVHYIRTLPGAAYAVPASDSETP